MNFKRSNEFIIIVLLGVCLLLSKLSIAQDNPIFDDLKKASIAATEWFQAIAVPITAIVEAEKRRQLREVLSELSIYLYSIEHDKLMFIELLKRDKLDKNAIYKSTSLLQMNIDNARKSLKKVGPLLRFEYQHGGDKVEALLSEAAVTRKIWINQLYDMPDDFLQRQEVIAEGEEALKALRNANLELSKLITKL